MEAINIKGKTKRGNEIATGAEALKRVVYDTTDLNLWYGENHALKEINLPMYEKEVTAIIGPSGCGKSTFIKSLNRMVELVPNVRLSGTIRYNGESILRSEEHTSELQS